MKSMINICVLCGFLMLLSTCEQSTSFSNTDKLFEVEWELRSFEQIPGAKLRVPQDQIYTLNVKKNFEISGRADCNLYGGQAVIQSGAIAIRELTQTEIACGPASQGDKFVNALMDASNFEVDDNSLRIFYDANMGALNFVRNEK